MQTKLFKRVLTGVLSAALVVGSANFVDFDAQAAKTVKKLTVSQTLDDGTTAAVKKKGTVNVAYPKNAADAKYVAKGNFNVELTGKGASKGFKLKGAGTPVGDTGFFVEQTAAGTAEKVSVKVISKAKNKNGKKLKFPFKVAFVEDSAWTVATSLSIAVDKTTLLVGDTAQITATVEPKDATVTYSSDKEAVATVDATGKIEAKGAGEATITAKAGDKTDSVKVTVYAEAIKITGVELDNLKPQAGDTLTANLVPANAMNVAGYSWTVNGAAIPDTNEPTYTIPETAKIGDKYNVVVTDTEGATFTAAAPAVVSEKEEPVVIVNLLDAVQTKANEIKLTFDANASEIVEKGDIEVAAEDGTLVIPLNNLTFTEDGLTAFATLSVALIDGKSYSVSYGDNKVSGLVASVGAVDSVVVDTVSAEVKVKTPIKFSLYDAKGIDVTSSVNLDATCQVAVAGDMTYDVSKASTASITMDTVGQTAEVTVTYNSNENGAKDIVGTQTITATAAQAVYGDPLYAVTTDVNKNSLCAKFYKGVATTDKVVIGEGKSTDDLYFCAVDASGDAISYDSYSVASSSDDVANAAIGTADNGKYAKISVSGNKVGEASVIVTATKNGVDSIYSVPVKVVKSGILDHITVTASKTSMSNAYDEEYDGTITVKALDANGMAADDCQYAYELTSGKTDAVKGLEEAWGLAEGTLGFDLDGYGAYATYTAWGAQAGSRTIKVTVSQGDIEKTQSVTVNVSALAEACWNNGNTADRTPAKATYQVELSNNILDEANVAGAPSWGTARLAAYFGSNFAGYVRQTNGKVTIGEMVGGKASAGQAAVYALNGTEDDVWFYANRVGAQYNGFGFTTSANAEAIQAVRNIYNESKPAQSAVFTAVEGSIADGKAGNYFAFEAKEDIAEEVKGQYDVTFTDGSKAWADGDVFTIDGEILVLASEISARDMGSKVADLIEVNKTLGARFNVEENGGGVITLTEKKSGEAITPTFVAKNYSEGAVTPEFAVVRTGENAVAAEWSVGIDGTWAAGDYMTVDGTKLAITAAEAGDDATAAALIATKLAALGNKNVIGYTFDSTGSSLLITEAKGYEGEGEPEVSVTRDAYNVGFDVVTTTTGESAVTGVMAIAFGGTATATSFNGPLGKNSITVANGDTGAAAAGAFAGEFAADVDYTAVATDNVVTLTQKEAADQAAFPNDGNDAGITWDAAVVIATGNTAVPGVYNIFIANNWTAGDSMTIDGQEIAITATGASVAGEMNTAAAAQIAAGINSKLGTKYTAAANNHVITLTQTVGDDTEPVITAQNAAAGTEKQVLTEVTEFEDAIPGVYRITYPTAGTWTILDEIELANETLAVSGATYDQDQVASELKTLIEDSDLADYYTISRASNVLSFNQKVGNSNKPDIKFAGTGNGKWAIKTVKEGTTEVNEGVTGDVDEEDEDVLVFTIHVEDKTDFADIVNVWNASSETGLFTATLGNWAWRLGEDAHENTVVYDEDTKAYTIYSESDATLADIADIFNGNQVENFFTAAVVEDIENPAKGQIELGKDGASSVLVTEATQIENIKAGVKFGAKYSINGDLFNSKVNIAKEKNELGTYGTRLWIDTVNDEGNKFYVEGDTTKDGYFARVGSYTAVFTYNNVADGKEGTQSAAFTVRNSNYIPKVNVTDRNVEGLDPTSVKTVLTASVDMNNNESASFSVVDGLYSDVNVDGTTKDASESNGKMTVKYVGVVEDEVTYYIPINATFQTK